MNLYRSSRWSCSRNIHGNASSVDSIYMPFQKGTFMDIGSTFLCCRLYTKDVPNADIEGDADDIWTKLCRCDHLPVVDAERSKDIIRLLLSFRYHKNHIIRELSQNTVLLKYPTSQWKETISYLQSYGFHGAHFLPLLAGYHTLLSGTAWGTLQEVLTFLHSVHIPHRNRQEIIARNPMLLFSDDTRPFLNNYSNLLKVFTRNEAVILVTKNPNLLTDPVEETNDKINYVYYEMGIRSREMTRSRAFEHPLSHIITRHKFAERAGLYKAPDKHEIAAKELNLQTVVASANPSLSDLVDTRNAAFIKLFSGLTVAEYEAFVAMMSEVQDKTEDDADSDVSDSDTDDE